jgi:hypothetical protein
MKINGGLKMVKKLFGIFVLAIFILSVVPMALAETGNANEGMKEAKEKWDLARNRYAAAKENYKAAKEKYQNHKGNILEIRERVKACKEDDECKKGKKDLKVGVKNHLGKTGDVILRSLDKLKSRIEDSKTMTDDEKENALARLSVKEEELLTLIDRIKEMSEDATAEELREAIKSLKDLWKEIQREQKWVITQLINHRLSTVVDKHDEYYNAMEMRYSTLEEKGASAEDLESLKEIMERFREEVAKLNVEQEEATEAWKRAKSSPEGLEEAKAEQEDVREQMKITKEVLREFTAEFKEIYQELKTDEVEDESEDETGEETTE